MQHATFSPSNAPRWANCTASFYVNEATKKKSESSIYSHEGTIAHTIASKVLKEEASLESFLGYSEDFRGQEIRFDRESIDHIQEYIDIIISYAREGELWVEERVRVDDDIWGTSDARVLVGTTLHIFDLKFGRGEVVEVKGNEQMVLYAEGAMNELDPLDNPVKHVVVHIIQPRRADGKDTHQQWECSLEELAPHVNRIMEAKEKIQKGPEYTEFNPGDKQCRWCMHKGKCKAQADYNLGMAGLTFSQFVEDDKQDIGESLGLIDDSFKEIEDEDLFAMKDKFSVMQLWIKQMQEEMLRRAIERRKKGESLYGTKIVASVKHRQWSKADEVQQLAERILEKKPDEFSEEDFFTEPKLRSPAQFEKGPLRKLKKMSPKAADKITQYIYKPQGSPILVDESDNRAEFPIDAETVFNDYAGEE